MTAFAERTATLAAASANVTTYGEGDPRRVDTPHADYARVMARVNRCRAAMQGTDAWRALRTTVLPQLEGETDASYEVRLTCAALNPGFEKAVQVGVGMLLQKEPTLDKDNDAGAREFYEDVDGSGTHGTLFCDDLVTAAAVDGISGIFTDYTRKDDPTLNRDGVSAAAEVDSNLDAADTKALGLRTYWVLVKVDEVIKEVYQRIGGVKTLVLFVRKQVVQRLVEPFGTETVERYYAYRLRGKVVSCQIFEKMEGQAQPVEVGTPIVLKNQTSIPWSPLRGGQRLSDNEVKPMLQGLCDLIEEYHQIWSSMLNCIQLSATNSLVRIGATPDENGDYPPITIGPRGVLEAPYLQGVQTPLYWINASSEAVVPAEQALVRNSTLQGLASASFLAPEKRAAETEKSKQLAAKAGNATLSGLGRRLQDCLELALLHEARFRGLAKGGSVTVNLDFEDALMGADVMIAYCKLVELGYSKRLALEALQLGGRVKPDANLDQLEADWEEALAIRQEQRALEAATLPEEDGADDTERLAA